MSYVRINLDVAVTEVAFFLFSHPDLVVSGPNFITSLVGRNSTDARRFKLPFTVVASPATRPLLFQRFSCLGRSIWQKAPTFLWGGYDQNVTHQISLVDYVFLSNLSLF